MLSFKFQNPHWQQLHDHIIRASQSGLRLAQRQSRTDRPGLVICGTGPTLLVKENLKAIRARQREGWDIWALKDSMRLLKERRIKVTGTVAMDPAPEQTLKTPRVEGVEYFLASSCHPKLFEHLHGLPITLFHSATGWQGEGTVPETGEVVQLNEVHLYKELFGNADTVVGGFTVANRAVGLGKLLGYPAIDLAGVPFGWRMGEEAYAEGAAGRLKPDASLVIVHTEPPWLSKPDLVASALHIAWAMKQGFVGYIGDGLPAVLAAMDEEELVRQFPGQWPGAKQQRAA
jgi:hypothetical protein